MKHKEVYPVFIKSDGKDFLVFIPDLMLYTEGKDLPDAIAMARDAIGNQCMAIEDDGMDLPEASSISEALEIAKKDADEDFDYSDGILTFVDVDLEAFRLKRQNRAVKKNCTIPYWMSVAAEKRGINFSKVLQEALVQQLNMS